MPKNGIVHLTRLKGRLCWSGGNASGGGEGGARNFVPHRIEARIDMGVDEAMYHLGSDDGRLHLLRGGKYLDFTPEGLLLTARCGYFGLKVVEEGSHG